MIHRIKRFIIRYISKVIILFITILSRLFNLSLLESGKLNERIAYAICRTFSSSSITLIVYSIFFKKNSKSAIRLQEIDTYSDYGKNYKKALLSVDKSLLGKTLVWRNKHTKNKRLQLVNNKKSMNILFATRSWHFFDPLFQKMKNKNIDVNKFDINEYDKIYYNTDVNKVNKNKIFRDLIFSSLKYSSELDRIIDYSKVSKLKEQDKNKIINSDIIFIDWLNQNSLWALENIPLDKKIVVRVHSYEVFSFYSLMLNYGRIDGLIFISEGIKNAFLELWGWLLPEDIKITVLQNIRSKERLKQKNKIDHLHRKKTIGMLQYSMEVKDLNFAIDVFEKLYEIDNEYKLLLGGNKLNINDFYGKNLLDRINSFPFGTIQEVGYVSDMDSFFSKIGFILSTSEREGSHESIIEGMVFGCVPAIRDWPLLSPFNGAKHSFPQFPVFDKAEELAEYIEKSQKEFKLHSEKSLNEVSYYFNENIDEDYLTFINKIRGLK